MILGYINWNASPEIFSVPQDVWLIGGLTVRWYGLLFAASFFFGYLIVQNIFKKEGIKQELLDKLTIYMALGVIIGARLGHCFFYQPGYYLENPWEIIQVWKGGLASHGAAIGILLALYMFARKVKKPYLWILDRMVIVVALSGLFIRTGNFINSEIIGKPASFNWAVIFNKVDNIPRHPAQIYEALSYSLIFLFLMFAYYKLNYGKIKGLMFGIFLITVFTARFIIEFFKDVQVNFEKSMTLNMGQILSIPFVIAGIVMIFFSLKSKPEQEQEQKQL